MTNKPELQGEDWGWRDGRYRVYTVDHIPYDGLPRYADGGPAMVVHTTWCKSTSRLDRFFSSPSVVAADDGRVTLNVYRFDPVTGVQERHPLDGTTYATTDAADRAAYDAGVTAFMVYERDAHLYGLAD